MYNYVFQVEQTLRLKRLFKINKSLSLHLTAFVLQHRSTCDSCPWSGDGKTERESTAWGRAPHRKPSMSGSPGASVSSRDGSREPTTHSPVKPEDSISNAGSRRSEGSRASMVSSRSVQAAKVAALEARRRLLTERHSLEVKQQAARREREAKRHSLEAEERALRERREAERYRQEEEEEAFRREKEAHDLHSELLVARAEERALNVVLIEQGQVTSEVKGVGMGGPLYHHSYLMNIGI